MKHFNQYINEFLVKGHTNKKQEYKYFPKTKEELQEIINIIMEKEGSECDLNDIDVSKIADMSWLSNGLNNFDGFNCDVSKWDVSNVTDMEFMFTMCKNFNQDISSWDVSNVENMKVMFCGCSNFNQDLSSWDVSKVKDMNGMFFGCKALKNKPSWYVSLN